MLSAEGSESHAQPPEPSRLAGGLALVVAPFAVVGAVGRVFGTHDGAPRTITESVADPRLVTDVLALLVAFAGRTKGQFTIAGAASRTA